MTLKYNVKFLPTINMNIIIIKSSSDFDNTTPPTIILNHLLPEGKQRIS